LEAVVEQAPVQALVQLKVAVVVAQQQVVAAQQQVVAAQQQVVAAQQQVVAKPPAAWPTTQAVQQDHK
jgi:hypothetical protein